MLVPDPKAVRNLLTRYAVLRISQAERYRTGAAEELNDVVHALCEMMGATCIREAIDKADAVLAAARGAAVDGRAAA